MRRRPLGTTGIEVSELGLGTFGLSGDGYGPVAESEQDRVIERALALGVTLFETADSYAHGDMERRLGRLLPKAGVAIVTKVGTDREASPPRKRFDQDFLASRVDACRRRLDRQRLEVVLLHNPSERAVRADPVPLFFEGLVKRQEILAWGVSTPDEAVARAAVAQGARLVETPYNALNSHTVTELLPLLKEKDIALLAHSVLAYGLLAGAWAPDKEFLLGDHRRERWTPDELRARLRQLRALRPAVHGDIHSLRSVALRFVLANEQVSAAVLGPRSALQLDQLVREAGTAPPYLAEEALRALRARLDDAGVPA